MNLRIRKIYLLALFLAATLALFFLGSSVDNTPNHVVAPEKELNQAATIDHETATGLSAPFAPSDCDEALWKDQYENELARLKSAESNASGYQAKSKPWWKFKQGDRLQLVVHYPPYESYDEKTLAQLANQGDVRAETILALNELFANNSKSHEEDVANFRAAMAKVESAIVAGETDLMFFVAHELFLKATLWSTMDKERYASEIAEVSAKAAEWHRVSAKFGSFHERIRSRLFLNKSGAQPFSSTSATPENGLPDLAERIAIKHAAQRSPSETEAENAIFESFSQIDRLMELRATCKLSAR